MIAQPEHAHTCRPRPLSIPSPARRANWSAAWPHSLSTGASAASGARLTGSPAGLIIWPQSMLTKDAEPEE